MLPRAKNNIRTALVSVKLFCDHLSNLHNLINHLTIFIFRCLHGLVPCYLSDDIQRFADTNRRRLCSSSSTLLTVRPTRLVTMGDRAFPVAGSRLWNSLPHEVTSACTSVAV